MSASCPYCPPFDFGWGGGDEMWAEMKKVHDREHDRCPNCGAPGPMVRTFADPYGAGQTRHFCDPYRFMEPPDRALSGEGEK